MLSPAHQKCGGASPRRKHEPQDQTARSWQATRGVLEERELALRTRIGQSACTRWRSPSSSSRCRWMLLPLLLLFLANAVASQSSEDEITSPSGSTSDRLSPSAELINHWRSLAQRHAMLCLPLMPLQKPLHEHQCCAPTDSQPCTLMKRCKQAMCQGRVPVGCLSNVGQQGPHLSYASHPPFMTIRRQGGYGVSVGLSFSSLRHTDTVWGASNSGSATSGASSSTSRRRGSADPISSLAMTDVTEVEYDLDELRSTGNSAQHFSTLVRAGGRHRHCWRSHAKMRIKVQCIQADAMHKVSLDLFYKPASSGRSKPREKKLDLNLNGCSKLRLSTQLHVHPRHAFALRSSCFVVWKNAVITAPRQESSCDLQCNETKDIVLSCLGKTKHRERGRGKVTSQPLEKLVSDESAEKDDDEQESVDEDSSDQFSNSFNIVPYSAKKSNKNKEEKKVDDEEGADLEIPALDDTSYPEQDIRLVMDGSKQRRSYVADIQTARRLGKKFDYISGRLILDSRRNLRNSQHCPLDQRVKLKVRFRILVNRRVAWSRVIICHLSANQTKRKVLDIDDFAINIWKVRSPRQLTLEAYSPDNVHKNCSCTQVAIFKTAFLRQQVKPPRFKPGCQDQCLKQQQRGDGTAYLSCFLGGKPKKSNRTNARLRFSCSGAVTGVNNSFISVATNNGKGHIGVNRAGDWTTRKQAIRLTNPNQPNNYTDYINAIGARPNSDITISLTQFRRMGYIFNTFSSVVGLDLLSGCPPERLGSVSFEIWLDKKLQYKADVIHAWASRAVSVDVANALELKLVTRLGRISQHQANCWPSVWANARLGRLQLA